MAMAILLASGRLIPRALQRMNPTVSDCFLITSIFNMLALFITDTMTYQMGGMAGEGPSGDGLIKLKKVRLAVKPQPER